MKVNLALVSIKTLLFLTIVYAGWAEYPQAVKVVNSYIDYRIEEHLASSINVPNPPPPMQELDGYNLNRQPDP